MNIFKLIYLPGRGLHLYPEITFESETMVKGPYTFYPFPKLGLCVYVPPNISMVIVSSNNKRIVLGEGYRGEPDLPMGRYQVYFVSLRQGYLPITDFQALSADSLNTRVSVDIAWQVMHPEIIIGVVEPLQQFRAFCEAGIATAIREKRHQEIIETAFNPGQATNLLCQHIRYHIDRLQRRSGIAVTGLSLRSIYGIPEITDRAKDYVAAQAEQKVVEANGEIKKVENEYALLVESIHQTIQALENARDNFSQEPNRIQERILSAMGEIGQLVAAPMRFAGAGSPGYQPYLFGMDPAFAQAIQSGIKAIQELALSKTLPEQAVKIVEELLATAPVSSGGNGHYKEPMSASMSLKPFSDPAKRPIKNEPLAS